MIKSILAPYELYIWAAVAVLLLFGGVFEIRHLENIGVQREQAHEAALAKAQEIHKQEVEDRAQVLVQASGGQLHAALVAPDTVAPFAVRLCPSPPTARLVVSADGGPVTGEPSVNTGSTSLGDGSAGQGVDIAPVTEGILRRQDAEIAYWRSYYATCKAQGICK